MLIPMACSSSHCVVITLLTYVVRVLVLPRKVKFTFNWISRCILMWNEYWFYPGKLLLFLSEDLDFTLKYTYMSFWLVGKKRKFANPSIYNVVSDHNFRQTITYLDEVYLNQNSGLSLNYIEFFFFQYFCKCLNTGMTS